MQIFQKNLKLAPVVKFEKNSKKTCFLHNAGVSLCNHQLTQTCCKYPIKICFFCQRVKCHSNGLPIV